MPSTFQLTYAWAILAVWALNPLDITHGAGDGLAPARVVIQSCGVHHQELHPGWVSLDLRDNRPMVLTRYVLPVDFHDLVAVLEARTLGRRASVHLAHALALALLLLGVQVEAVALVVRPDLQDAETRRWARGVGFG